MSKALADGRVTCKTGREVGKLTMSTITIGTLPRMTRDVLSALLLSQSSASKVAVVDVRDSGTSSLFHNKDTNWLRASMSITIYQLSLHLPLLTGIPRLY